MSGQNAQRAFLFCVCELAKEASTAEFTVLIWIKQIIQVSRLKSRRWIYILPLLTVLAQEHANSIVVVKVEGHFKGFLNVFQRVTSTSALWTT